MKLCISLLGLISLITSSFAATYLSGNLTTRTWITNDSPYVLTNDTAVPVGQVLTIQPGVTVAGRESELVIQGTIIATGSFTAPIIFDSETTALRWKGLRLSGASASSIISYCKFSRASEVLGSSGGLQIEDCNPPVTDCILEENDTTGLYLQNSSSTISRCIIRNNSTINTGAGIYSTGDGLKLYNTLICNNTAYRYAAGYADTVTMRNCTIAENHTSVFYGGINYTFSSGLANSACMNCIFAGNTHLTENADGIDNAILLNCLDHSAVFPPTFKNPTSGPGRRDLNDTGTGYPADYSLTAASPGVDQGTNTYAAMFTTDLAGNARINNTNVDIGCYEYIPNYGSNLLTSIERAVHVTAGSEPGKRYQFRYQTSPTGTNWLNLGDMIDGTGGTIGVFDSVNNSTSRLYRAFVVP
jgi:hypothetical protein